MEQILAQTLGQFPTPNPGKSKIDQSATAALTGTLWQNDVPAFSMLWLAEPDFTQHRSGPGSKDALAAIKSSDDNLARVLRALKARRRWIQPM